MRGAARAGVRAVVASGGGSACLPPDEAQPRRFLAEDKRRPEETAAKGSRWRPAVALGAVGRRRCRHYMGKKAGGGGMFSPRLGRVAGVGFRELVACCLRCPLGKAPQQWW